MENNKIDLAAHKTARRRQRIRKKLAGVLAVLCVVLIIFAFITSFSKSMAYDIYDAFKSGFSMGAYPTDAPSGSFRNCVAAKKSICAVSEKEIVVMKAGGAVLMHSEHGIANPCVAANGNRILVYSSSGKTYKVYNRSRLIETGVSDYSIVSGDVSSRGRILILSNHDEYSSELDCLESSGLPRFTWYGSEGFPFAVFAADNYERAAVVSLKTDGGKLISVITLLDLTNNKEISTFYAEGTVLHTVFSADDIICVFTDRAERFSSSGESKLCYTFNGGDILDISSYSSGNFAVALGDNKRSQINKILILSTSLSEVMNLEFGETVDGMYINSDRLSILSGKIVYSYSNTGKYRGMYDAGESAVCVIDIGGPIAINASHIRKLEMKGDK